MATATETPAKTQDDLGGDAPYPITADQYVAMVEAGIIPYDRPVYLWGGRLLEKMAKTSAHAAAQNLINMVLVRRLPPGYFVGNENPVRLDPTHVPLPDLVVVRGSAKAFVDRYPGPGDVVAVVEVAVSSLPADLGVRRARYASTLPGATYLVADVRDRKIHVHRGPSPDRGGSYAETEGVGPGGTVRLAFDGRDLPPIPYEDLLW